MKMNKIIPIMFFMFIFALASVNALNLVTGEEYTITGTCILANGTLDGDNMSLWIYYPNSTSFISNQLMNNFATGFYNHTFTVPSTEGTYPYSMTCCADSVCFSSSDTFEVFNSTVRDFVEVNTTINNKTTSALVMFLPLALSIIFLAGAITFSSEKHGALKIGLYLASIPPLFTSLNWAVISIDAFDQVPELVNAISEGTRWIAWLYYAIIAYFCIYLIMVIFKYLEKRKMERVQY